MKIKKYLIIIFLFIPFIFAASIQDMQKAVIARKNEAIGIIAGTPSCNNDVTDGATGITITKPSGLQDNDVMYAFIAKDDDAGAAEWASTGWTLLDTNTGTSGWDYTNAVFRKVVADAGSEAANYTFTDGDGGEEKAGCIVAFTGVDNTTPEDQTTVITEDITNDDTPTCPTITTQTANAMVIMVEMGNNSNEATAQTLTQPSGYTQLCEENTDYHAQIGVGYKIQASVGASGTGDFNNTPSANNAEWGTWTLALRPE